jgi:hypothetical protein
VTFRRAFGNGRSALPATGTDPVRIVESLEWLEKEHIPVDVASPTTLVLHRNDFHYLQKEVLHNHSRYSLLPVQRAAKLRAADGTIDKKALLAERDDLRSELKYLKSEEK